MSGTIDDKVLVTIALPAEIARNPTVERVSEYLGLNTSDVDLEFGIVQIDPRRRLFAAMITANEVQRISAADNLDLRGPYSDVPITTSED